MLSLINFVWEPENSGHWRNTQKTGILNLYSIILALISLKNLLRIFARQNELKKTLLMTTRKKLEHRKQPQFSQWAVLSLVYRFERDSEQQCLSNEIRTNLKTVTQETALFSPVFSVRSIWVLWAAVLLWAPILSLDFYWVKLKTTKLVKRSLFGQNECQMRVQNDLQNKQKKTLTSNMLKISIRCWLFITTWNGRNSCWRRRSCWIRCYWSRWSFFLCSIFLKRIRRGIFTARCRRWFR